MTSQPGQQTIAIHILTNILRSKTNQAVNPGQFIEYNLQNIFLENHAQNVMQKLFPDPFLKNKNWAYLWINILKLHILFFLFVYQVEYILFYCLPLAFASYKAFLKNKKRSWTSLPASFSAWFLKQNISLAVFYYLTNFNVCLFLLRVRYWAICILQLFVNQVVTS